MLYSFGDLFGHILAVSDAACQDDLIDLPLQNSTHRADILGNLIDERVQNQLRLFIQPLLLPALPLRRLFQGTR